MSTSDSFLLAGIACAVFGTMILMWGYFLGLLGFQRPEEDEHRRFWQSQIRHVITSMIAWVDDEEQYLAHRDLLDEALWRYRHGR